MVFRRYNARSLAHNQEGLCAYRLRIMQLLFVVWFWHHVGIPPWPCLAHLSVWLIVSPSISRIQVWINFPNRTTHVDRCKKKQKKKPKCLQKHQKRKKHNTLLLHREPGQPRVAEEQTTINLKAF